MLLTHFSLEVMNCCCVRKQSVHREIEKGIKTDRRRKKREIQILLFGKNRSGKTTLFRQLQIIHGNKFSEEVISSFAIHIYQNIFMAIKALIDAMTKLEIAYAEEKNEPLAEFVSSVDAYHITSMSEEHANVIKQLWADQGIQLCYNRKEKFIISNSAKYFLDDIGRISKHDYTPSEQDIIMADIPTTGLHEFTFEKGDLFFRVMDFKLQNFGQRRIWFQFFENTHVIIFVLDISEYDQLAEGSGDENKVKESKDLFKLIVSHPWFSGTSVVLFFNKIDLFREKIMLCHLAEYFPEYSGPKHDADSASDFLKQMFLDVNQEKDRPIFSHFTCAIDTPSMARVYDNVIQSVVQSHVKRFRVM